MFTDPQTVTINAIAISLPRISQDGTSATYRSADENTTLKVSHQRSNKKVRSVARIDVRAVVADPLTSENDYETDTIYIVFERPEVGFSAAAVNLHAAGFLTWLTPTIITKMMGGES